MLKNFDNDNWIVLYIYWELNLLKELGFDPNLYQFKKIIDQNDTSKTVTIDNIKYLAPNFLINKNYKNKIDANNIKIALSFTRNLMLNKFFLPNNIIFPKTRIILENYFS